MGSTELETETFAAEQPKQRTISRAVAEFTPGEGRTIDVQIVPFGVAADVSDGGPTYREMWMPGAFADQVRAADAGRARQVFVNFEHRAGISDVLGHGLTLRERPDAFYGSFVLAENPDGDKALGMVRDGLLTGVSLEAFAKKTIRTTDGVVQRVKAHLVNIALCRRPSFETAGVLAVREEEFTLDEEMLPVDAPEDIVARCRKLGMKLPDRFTIAQDAEEDSESSSE